MSYDSNYRHIEVSANSNIKFRNVKEIKSKLCGLVSKQDFTVTQASKGTKKLLKIYLEDIFQILKGETSLKLNELKGILTINFFWFLFISGF